MEFAVSYDDNEGVLRIGVGVFATFWLTEPLDTPEDPYSWLTSPAEVVGAKVGQVVAYRDNFRRVESPQNYELACPGRWRIEPGRADSCIEEAVVELMQREGPMAVWRFLERERELLAGTGGRVLAAV